jgi:hypothetical protein
MQDTVSTGAPTSINGFFAVFVLFVWGFLYLWLMAAGVHRWLRLDALGGKLEVLAYALHIVPIVVVPMAIFRFARRREAARDRERAAAAEADVAAQRTPQPAEPIEEFSQLRMKTFASRIGVVLQAPESWTEEGDEKVFQLVDPKSGTQISASCYVNPGVTVEESAGFRFQAVDKAMPWLRRVRAAYPLSSANWRGLACEYEGVFPGGTDTRHSLVLCICAGQNTYSITVTALQSVFEQRQRFYKWLLQNKLEIQAAAHA